MEMDCSSMTESGGSSSSSPPNSSTESLNGLKFGKKIYFEDVGPGTPSKSGARSSSSGPGSGAGPSKKVKAGIVQTGQPPRCQVEGCEVDLSDAKAYYSRHKVCGMHSKTPKVIVAGLEQRFCQQCSRFHQLPEFDQGKRSCRRRLAGHNERRRKPPPGSLLSTRYGRLSTPIFENSNRVGVGVGSFLMDFSAYPRLAGRDAWTLTRTSERVPGNQSINTAVKLLPNLWQSNSESPPSDLFLQGSAGGSSFSGQGISPGECISGVTDSSCALSLLSNQPWPSRDRPSGLVVHSSVNAEGVPVVQPTAPHGGTVNHCLTTSWAFKENVTSSSSQEILPNLGPGQMLQPLTIQFSGEVDLSQQNRRQFMELGHSRDYDSAGQNIPWSL